jgi:thiamine-monophosphate kinase
VTRHTHEFELIEWIRSIVGESPRIPVGIGDDAAAIHFPRDAKCLFATDMLMEGVHFRCPPATPRQIGRKALAVNLSDMAAMAGRPLAAFVSIALPKAVGRAWAEELHRGIHQLAMEFGVTLAGGDTNSWNGPFVISVGVIGESTERGPVLRRGAQPGDWIMTTGAFGGSLSGKHLSFQPRIMEALQLHEAVSLHAMIDVSDGLASDLHHILAESGVGAVLHEKTIPISTAAHDINDGQPALWHALGDGEDFELLFTVSREEGQRLLDRPPFDVPLAHIGEIVVGAGCVLRDADGRERVLPTLGWQHEL